MNNTQKNNTRSTLAEDRAKQTNYAINNYTKRDTFASFLPGIAGIHGIPIWCFFVNRGQGVCSFGVENKDKSILEFHPANKSYELVNSYGFRTFIKLGKKVYEPFKISAHSTQNMYIETNIFCIEDINLEHNIKTTVKYFILPNEFFGALLRTVCIENLGETREIEVIDGLPELIPAGLSTKSIKDMSFTAKAWAEVVCVAEGSPQYRVRTSIGDTETVEKVSNAVFFLNTHEGKINKNIIVDRALVFEYFDDLSVPVGFMEHSLETLLSKTQQTENQYSSAFATFTQVLKKDQVLTFESYFGYTPSEQEMKKIVAHIQSENARCSYVANKEDEARALTSELAKDIQTSTRYELFDQFCMQSYIDNILRGGYPLVFDQEDGNKLVYHVYARKHGDLERDYNFFNLEPRHYSQGNGNFRDICQNRRNDIFFNPDIGDSNVISFLNLLQIDGYNPLFVKGLTLSITDNAMLAKIAQELGQNIDTEFASLLQSFTPGILLEYAYNKNILKGHTHEEFLAPFMRYANTTRNAQYGEGYWIDHFSYQLDLIESYLDVYPENACDLLFSSQISYFNSPTKIASRAQKYKLHHEKVVQVAAVEELEEKEHHIEKLGHNFLVDEQGEIYYGTAFEKLLCLVSNRVSSIDPCNHAIEMEAGKPGWNDALNGLPGMIGAGVSEFFEVLRIVDFLIANLSSLNAQNSKSELHPPIEINETIAHFSTALSELLDTKLPSLERWEKASTLREEYREELQNFLPSKKIIMSVDACTKILTSYKRQIDIGVKSLFETYTGNAGLIPTFIINELTKYTKEKNDTKLIAQKFEAQALPPFLEAPVKSMYVLDKDSARDLYRTIKKSDIYDKKLKMYKTSVSLEHVSDYVGRVKAFTPGWLERESIFMHMQFKYLLKILEKELYEEFYEEIETVLPCFMDEKVYGRPIIEASSFIVSSVNANELLHGRGFSARLSGATSETLSLWKLMFLGRQLFCYKDNSLHFSLAPRLSAKFFGDDGIIKTTLFSKIAIEIYNPNKQDTYYINPSSLECDGTTVLGNTISGALAHKIRNREVSSIKVMYN